MRNECNNVHCIRHACTLVELLHLHKYNTPHTYTYTYSPRRLSGPHRSDSAADFLSVHSGIGQLPHLSLAPMKLIVHHLTLYGNVLQTIDIKELFYICAWIQKRLCHHALLQRGAGVNVLDIIWPWHWSGNCRYQEQAWALQYKAIHRGRRGQVPRSSASLASQSSKADRVTAPRSRGKSASDARLRMAKASVLSRVASSDREGVFNS